MIKILLKEQNSELIKEIESNLNILDLENFIEQFTFDPSDNTKRNTLDPTEAYSGLIILLPANELKTSLFDSIGVNFSNEPQCKEIKSIWVSLHYGKKVKLNQDDILWVKVNGNYTYIQTKSSYYIENKSLIKISKELSNSFIQIHKSILINKSSIKKLNLSKGTITLLDNSTFSIGRTYKSKLVKELFEEA